jgi:hypothetical protein
MEETNSIYGLAYHKQIVSKLGRRLNHHEAASSAGCVISLTGVVVVRSFRRLSPTRTKQERRTRACVQRDRNTH